MVPIIEGVEISNDVVVQCYRRGSIAIRAKNYCPECPDFAGIGHFCADESKPWHDRFCIRCVAVKEMKTYRLPKVLE